MSIINVKEAKLVGEASTLARTYNLAKSLSQDSPIDNYNMYLAIFSSINFNASSVNSIT